MHLQLVQQGGVILLQVVQEGRVLALHIVQEGRLVLLQALQGGWVVLPLEVQVDKDQVHLIIKKCFTDSCHKKVGHGRFMIPTAIIQNWVARMNQFDLFIHIIIRTTTTTTLFYPHRALQLK